MSDHKMIKFTRFSKSFKQSARFVTKRMLKNFDDESFKQELADTDLDEVLSCSDVNEAAEICSMVIRGNQETSGRKKCCTGESCRGTR